MDIDTGGGGGVGGGDSTEAQGEKTEKHTFYEG
jgi:hypothetical protein